MFLHASVTLLNSISGFKQLDARVCRLLSPVVGFHILPSTLCHSPLPPLPLYNRGYLLNVPLDLYLDSHHVGQGNVKPGASPSI